MHIKFTVQASAAQAKLLRQIARLVKDAGQMAGVYYANGEFFMPDIASAVLPGNPRVSLWLPLPRFEAGGGCLALDAKLLSKALPPVGAKRTKPVDLVFEVGAGGPLGQTVTINGTVCHTTLCKAEQALEEHRRLKQLRNEIRMRCLGRVLVDPEAVAFALKAVPDYDIRPHLMGVLLEPQTHHIMGTNGHVMYLANSESCSVLEDRGALARMARHARVPASGDPELVARQVTLPSIAARLLVELGGRQIEVTHPPMQDGERPGTYVGLELRAAHWLRVPLADGEVIARNIGLGSSPSDGGYFDFRRVLPSPHECGDEAAEPYARMDFAADIVAATRTHAGVSEASGKSVLGVSINPDGKIGLAYKDSDGCLDYARASVVPVRGQLKGPVGFDTHYFTRAIEDLGTSEGWHVAQASPAIARNGNRTAVVAPMALSARFGRR